MAVDAHARDCEQSVYGASSAEQWGTVRCGRMVGMAHIHGRDLRYIPAANVSIEIAAKEQPL